MPTDPSQGTRIIGQYDNGVGFGQRRVLLVWNRLTFPNGHSIVLERQPGADAEVMPASRMVSTITGGIWPRSPRFRRSSAWAPKSDDNDRLIRAIRDGAQDTINQAGQQIVQRQLQIASTLTIRPGSPVRIIVTRDL